MGWGKDIDLGRDSPDSLVVELVTLVSELKGVEAMELPPLADTIDPDAVERTLESDKNGSATVNFEYAGCDILVTGNGEVFLLSGP